MARTLASRWLLALWSLAFVLVATRTAAQPTTPARALAQDGKALVDAGNYGAGCPKLEQAWQMDSELLGAGFTLGECYERQGKLASAKAQFSLIAAKAAARGEPRAVEAQGRADAIASRVSTVTIKVPDSVASAAGLEVQLDGKAVTPSMFGMPIPKDGGRYQLTVNATGKKTWGRVLDLPAERGRLEVVLELGAPGERDATPPPRGTDPRSSGPSSTASDGMPALRIGGIVTTAVGGVGIVLGITFGVLAKTHLDRSNAPGVCDEVTNFCQTPAGVHLRKQTLLFGNVSTAMFVIGGAAAAAGIIMLVVPVGGSSVRAALSPTSVGLFGEF